MDDFVMQRAEEGQVIFKAISNKAKDWCVAELRQMADPMYDESYADAAKVLFERQGFKVRIEGPYKAV